MDAVNFFVLGHPEPAGSKTNMPRRRFPVTLHSMREFLGAFPLVDANPKAKRWKDTVSATAAGRMLRERLKPFEGPLSVEMIFYRARPESHYTSKGALSKEGQRKAFPQSKPDTLKLARAVEDAMTGIVYTDDALIVDERLRKEYGEPEGVRVVVTCLG